MIRYLSLVFIFFPLLMTNYVKPAVASEHDELEVTMEQLERELMEIRELAEDAEQDGQTERLRDLLRKEEKLADKLEHLEHVRHEHEHDREHGEHGEHGEHEHEHGEHREHDDDDHQAHEMEQHRRHLELRAFEIEVQMLEAKLQKSRLEVEMIHHEAAARLAKTAADPRAMTVIAMQRVVGAAEHPEHAAEILMGLLEKTREPASRRMVQLYLSELLTRTGRIDQAREVLLQLMSGPPARNEHPRPISIDADRRPRIDRERRREPRDFPGHARGEREHRGMEVFAAHDKDGNGFVSFAEWVRMKEGEMTPDRLELEQRRFGELAGDDGRIDVQEFRRWLDRRDRDGR